MSDTPDSLFRSARAYCYRLLTTYSGVRVVLVLAAAIALMTVLMRAPSDFPSAYMVTVPEGASLTEIAELLQDDGLIVSPSMFVFVATITGHNATIQAGQYFFEEPIGVVGVAERLLHGDPEYQSITVRIPEGLTRVQMADILVDALPSFDVDAFLTLTEGKEGYLFPDTYEFVPETDAQMVAERLEETFYSRVAPLTEIIASSTFSFEEIITIGSLIEREAFDPIDRRLISGVLMNRLDIDMALQLDAPLYFLTEKASSELTLDDLEIDSPYNTYVYRGLPPGPIASPSLDAIEAALNPTPSDYLFYLSDADGITHFAEDFEGHKRNKALYLQ